MCKILYTRKFLRIRYNLFISHKACLLVLDRLSRKVFVCTNFVIIVGVKTTTLKVSRQGDIIVITL